MPKIKLLNPSDIGIVKIAKKFHLSYPDKSLLNTFILAAYKDDDSSRDFLENNSILCRGASRIPSEGYLNYLHAVALAERRLKRDGNEYAIIDRLIEKNFSVSRKKVILDTIWETADTLYKSDESYGRNFLNYMIDKLIFISMKKKEESANSKEASSDIGDLDTELSSGDNGFILNCYEAEDITDLLFEAAITPWNINKKNI